jgi:hypothetical protein
MQIYIGGILADGVNMNPPTEWQSVDVQVNFDSGQGQSRLQTSKFTFEGKAAAFLNARVASGLTGGVGIMEGAALLMKDCNNVVFDGCIDLANDAEFECDRVSAPIRDNRLIDFIEDQAAGLTFHFLTTLPVNSPGRITAADYIQVPYVVEEIPDYTQAMITGIALFTTIQESAYVVKTVAGLIAEIANIGTTVSALIKVILYIAYLTVLVIALINLIQNLIDNIIQKQKFKLGMKVRTAFTRACQRLGLSFSSTIVNNPASQYYDLAIIPEKIVIPNPNNNSFLRDKDESLSVLSFGHPNGSFAKLIQDISPVFDAEVRLIGNTLYFENRHFWNNTAGYQLPPIQNRKKKYNTHELTANYVISYLWTSEDRTTRNEYDGTNVQVTTTANVVGNSKNNLLRGLTDVRIQYAHANRKTKLTRVEKLLDGVITGLAIFANTITGVINAIGNFNIPPIPTNILNNRIGWLRLSTDFIDVQKLFIADASNKVSAANKTRISAAALLSNFHFRNLPTWNVGSQTFHNQYVIYEEVTIPFCCADFAAVITNNVIKDFQGNYGKLISLRWQLGAEQAVVTYKIKETYDTNFSYVVQNDK